MSQNEYGLCVRFATFNPDDLPEDLTGAEAEFDADGLVPPNVPLPETLERIEEKLIRRAQSHCNNVQSYAAKILEITRVKNIIPTLLQ